MLKYHAKPSLLPLALIAEVQKFNSHEIFRSRAALWKTSAAVTCAESFDGTHTQRAIIPDRHLAKQWLCKSSANQMRIMLRKQKLSDWLETGQQRIG